MKLITANYSLCALVQSTEGYVALIRDSIGNTLVLAIGLKSDDMSLSIDRNC